LKIKFLKPVYRVNPVKTKSPPVRTPKGFYAGMCFCRTLNLLTLVRQNCIAAASGDRRGTATATTNGELQCVEIHV
jgi:hypothetical protein